MGRNMERRVGKGARYISYENQQIKRLSTLRNIYFDEELAKIVPSRVRWSAKVDIRFYEKFQYLNPYNVFIRRRAEDAAKSECEKRPGHSLKSVLPKKRKAFAQMDACFEKYGGIDVDTDKLVEQLENNEFSEIQAVIEYCELKFNPKAVKRAYSPLR